MPLGPGKYDDVCVEAMDRTQAHGIALIVFNGTFGSGFSVVGSPEVVAALPRVLRQMSKEIEDSIPRA